MAFLDYVKRRVVRSFGNPEYLEVYENGHIITLLK